MTAMTRLRDVAQLLRRMAADSGSRNPMASDTMKMISAYSIVVVPRLSAAM